MKQIQILLLIMLLLSVAMTPQHIRAQDSLDEVQDEVVEPEEDPETAGALFQEGYAHYESGELQEAAGKFAQAGLVYRALGEGFERYSIYCFSWAGGAAYGVSDLEDAYGYFAAALEIASALGDRVEVGKALSFLGTIDYARENYDSAHEAFLGSVEAFEAAGDTRSLIAAYTNLAALYEAAGREESLAVILNNTGVAHSKLGEDEEALAFYSRALEINRRLGRMSEIAAQLSNIGQIYARTGRLDAAEEHLSQALTITEDEGEELLRATVLNELGEVYRAWGWIERAKACYLEALPVAEGYEDADLLVTLHNNLGQVYRAEGNPEEALGEYLTAEQILKNTSLPGNHSYLLSNLGETYRQMGNLEKAMEYFTEALALDEAYGSAVNVAVRLNNIGLVCFEREEYEDALRYFEKAAAGSEEVNRPRNAAAAYSNLGDALYTVGEFSRAEEAYQNSIDIKERLRASATGAVRREYMESEIAGYRSLVVTYLAQGKLEDAYDATEGYTARYLLDQLETVISSEESPNEEKAVSFRGIREYAADLPEATAVITFNNIDRETADLLVADGEYLFHVVLDMENYIRDVERRFGDLILEGLKREGVSSEAGFGLMQDRVATSDASASRSRGIRVSGREQQTDSVVGFDEIVRYFRMLLATPRRSRRESDALETLSSSLWEFFFGQLEEELADKDALLIVPDGVLSMLPFGALTLDTGEYAAERYVFSYVPSLAVADRLDERKTAKAGDVPDPAASLRKPLLALGGAIYDEYSYDMPSDTNRRDEYRDSRNTLYAIREETFTNFQSGASQRGPISSLGFGVWSNLPGTYSEVQAIGELVSGSEVLTGARVSEAGLKRMSESGGLLGYRILHFAVHGMTVPEVPELSSLVLSQFAQEQDGQDGYLTLPEAAALRIDADFVNLSACDTGLGKIYRGEGVVGLAQAFLVAGAGGVGVSLWQVADEATREFMVDFYSRLIELNPGFEQLDGVMIRQAMTEVKREFIAQGVYSDPFFWAPFVYYGE